MLLETIIDGASITIHIAEPFRPDIAAIISQIEQLAISKGADITALDVKGLILEMIRGIVGCENGCPADAKHLISRGYSGFDLRYVEGGILTAHTATRDGKPIHLKMFPDF
ncbi:MAG: hypothetical protein ABSB95_10010 [Dissulfurispiraceae bacterium]|jgi:hypothetical protein